MVLTNVRAILREKICRNFKKFILKCGNYACIRTMNICFFY